MISSYSSAPIPPSSQTINGPNLSPVKHAQTITLTRSPLNVFLTYLGLYFSPGGRITHCRRGLTPIHSIDSSDQMTRFQSSIVQSLYLSAHSILNFICVGFNPGFSAAM